LAADAAGAVAVAGAEAAGAAAAAAAGAVPGLVHGTAFTGVPGGIICSFWKPSTITCSPALRPSSTTHWLSLAVPTLTLRLLSLPSAPTTVTVSPCWVRVTACCGSAMALSTWACSMRTRTYRPGSSSPLGLGTSARRVTWPVVGSTVRSVNSSLPGRAYSLPPSSTTRTLAAPAPSARLSLPSAIARRSANASLADWVKLT